MHETSNENGIRAICFSTNNNIIIKSTYFPHMNIHKETWQSPDGRTNNQIGGWKACVKHYGCKSCRM